MKINPSPPADKVVGSPQEVRDELRRERRFGYDVKVVYWKRINPWQIEVWYY